MLLLLFLKLVLLQSHKVETPMEGHQLTTN